MPGPFISNLGFAILTVVLSFIVLILVVGHPNIEHDSDYVELESGRHISYLIHGEQSRKNAILWLHGMLSCRHETNPISEEVLKDLDAYILAPDRAGYGESSVTARRTLDTNADDLIELLDALNVNKVFLVGVSGGGPHALTLAAKYPDRVRGILSLSGACEAGFFHADRIQGSDNPPNPKLLSFYTALKQRPWLAGWLRWLSETYAGGRALHSLFLEDVAKHALAGFTEVDRRCAVSANKGAYLIKVIPGALRQGIATPIVHDLLSVMLPSATNISSIPEKLQKATHLWHSDQDPQVNPVCLEEYKRMLPGASTKVIENGGHFAYWSCKKDSQAEALRGLLHKGLAS